MTVAIVSVGYDGTVDETQWANLIGKAGSSEYGVDLAGDFGVNPVAGQDRTVRVAPGKAWGHGVLDVMDVEQTLQFALPASGDRYDMIVLRRDWQPPGGSTTLAIVQGSASSVTLPARNTGTLGVLDDQPIALVRVSAGSTSVSITADLRVWARNGGATAKDTRALQYLGALGALVEISGSLWQRRAGSTGAEWVDLLKAEDTGWIVSGIGGAWNGPSSYFRYRRRNGQVEVRGRVDRNSDFLYPVPANGNIDNITIATLPPEFAPSHVSASLPSGAAGPNASFAVNTDGTVVLAALAPGVSTARGLILTFSGLYFLG